jgi:hypothetical protein
MVSFIIPYVKVGFTKNSEVIYQPASIYVANRMSFCCDVGRAMAQAVSRLSLTAKGWFYARVSVCGIYGVQSDTGQVYLRVLRFSPVSIIPPWLYTYISSGG